MEQFGDLLSPPGRKETRGREELELPPLLTEATPHPVGGGNRRFNAHYPSRSPSKAREGGTSAFLHAFHEGIYGYVTGPQPQGLPVVL